MFPIKALVMEVLLNTFLIIQRWWLPSLSLFKIIAKQLNSEFEGEDVDECSLTMIFCFFVFLFFLS